MASARGDTGGTEDASDVRGAQAASSRTPRVGPDRLRHYDNKVQRNAAYSRIRKSIEKLCVKLAVTCDCHSAAVFFPQSGRCVTTSTFATFIDALQMYLALEQKRSKSKSYAMMDFVEAYEAFASEDAGAAWLEATLARLEKIGISADVRERFGSAYRGSVLRYARGHRGLAVDVAGRLEKTLVDIISDLSTDDEIVDLTIPDPPAPTGIYSSAFQAAARAAVIAAIARPSTSGPSPVAANQLEFGAPAPTPLMPREAAAFAARLFGSAVAGTSTVGPFIGHAL